MVADTSILRDMIQQHLLTISFQLKVTRRIYNWLSPPASNSYLFSHTGSAGWTIRNGLTYIGHFEIDGTMLSYNNLHIGGPIVGDGLTQIPIEFGML